MYRSLEPAGLNIDTEPDGSWSPVSVIPYFNNNQANMANEAFYNGDAKYKYIRPAIEGYFDGLNNQQIKPGEAPYLYAAQGDRSIMREYFLTNRIKYLRGKHNSARFQNNDRITFRWYYPTGNEANFKETKQDENGNEYIVDHSSSIDAVPPSTAFDFESLQTCYAGVLLGANGNVIKERFNGEERKIIDVPEGSSANGTEAYLLGIGNLKDLGDLSNKYVQKFIMSGDNKLRTLTFGNPHKDYYNPFWKPKSGNATPIGISGCTYLRHFNLQNCSTYNAEIDFRSCPVIETILLTGSSTSGISLPVNGILKELRLPTSISKLNINSHQYLTDDKFSLGTYQYGPSGKIGEADGQYVDDFGYLTEICITNTPINTYRMVSNAVSLEAYYFEGFTWDILGTDNDTQYVTSKDETYIADKEYYIWNENSGAYVRASEADFTSQRNYIREQRKLVENGAINSIPILDYLMDKTPKKDGVTVSQQSALSGKIIIKVPNAKVNQFALYKKYQKEFPAVEIAYDENIIGSDNLIKAHKIEFFNTPNITAENEAYYTVLTDGTYSLKQLVAADGPANAALQIPSMQATNTIVYVFSGKWKEVGTNNIYNMDDNTFNFVPDRDMRLEPIYNETPRTYPIKFFDHNGTLIKTVEYSYLQIMANNKATPMYLGRSDEDLEWFERWTFKGWIGEKDFNNNNTNPVFIDLYATKVSYAMSLYPFFEIEDARKVATNLDYFDFYEKADVSYPKYIYSTDGSDTSTDARIDLGT
jgi:hypothetical protein